MWSDFLFLFLFIYVCVGESTEYCEGGDLEGVGSDKASGGGLRELNSVCKCGAKPIY